MHSKAGPRLDNRITCACIHSGFRDTPTTLLTSCFPPATFKATAGAIPSPVSPLNKHVRLTRAQNGLNVGMEDHFRCRDPSLRLLFIFGNAFGRGKSRPTLPEYPREPVGVFGWACDVSSDTEVVCVCVCVVCIPSPTAAVALAGSRRHFHKAILRTKRVDNVSSEGRQLVRCRQILKLCVVCALF